MDLLSMKSFAKSITDMTFTDYYYRLMSLARCVYKWENLPNSIDEKWIEKFLFWDGKCMFFEDDKLGLMVARCNPANTLNMYDEPTELMPYGINYVGKSRHLGHFDGKKPECVLIRNNDDMIPTSFTLKLFAYRLAEISRTIDINIAAQKTPVLILTSEKQRLTMKNVYTQWNGFEPVIFGDNNLDTNNITVLKTDAPIVFPELQVQKQAIWNECLTFLGINNANTEKRERLITDEVEANNLHIELSAECMLKARQKACDQINELYGTNISVSVRERSEVECMQNTQNTLET